MIKEFQRLKEQEAQQTSIEWQVKRELAKVNYRLQTDAVQMNLLDGVSKTKHGFIYANEADVINIVVFGKTHKEWQIENPNLKGNQRDNGSALDNAIVANLEFQNSLLIQQGYSPNDRINMLRQLEQNLRSSMSSSPAMKRLEQQSNAPLLQNKEND